MLLSFLLVWAVVTTSARAGQVVTDEVRMWAKEAIEQEKAFETISTPNTVAVLYFHNKTGWSQLDLLQKGLTLMLITDLSKVKEIQLLERVKVQALAEELGLGVSGLVESDTAPRVGKLLGVEHVIGGDILRGMIDDFQLTSNLLQVPAGEIYGQVSTEGKLLAELFRMEKDLLFEIINRLKIELTPELELELKKPLTTSIDAFRRLLQGLEDSDRGNYERAAASYQDSLKEDPNFTLAEDFLQELQGLQLWAGATEDDSKVEAYTELAGPILELIPDKRPDYKDLTEREALHELVDIYIDEYTKGDPPPIVNRSSLVEAQSNIANDDTLRAKVIKGDFVSGDFQQLSNDWGYKWSGRYKSGLQTVGVNEDESPGVFLTQDNLSWINRDPFLAYAVQVEEDSLNRKILEMHREAAQGDLLQTVHWQLDSGDIRSRDDFFMQKADAQAGRVLKDRNGHWVRVQQYILRPDDTSVQVLNVCLRGGGAGDLSGLSTIDWTTTFTGDGYPTDNDLRVLPWNDWLMPIEDDGYFVNNDSPVELGNMYVKFTNPDDESLQEQRWFDPRPTEGGWIGDWQDIDRDELTINDSDSYTYVSGSPEGFQYTVMPVPNTPGEFDYVLGDGRSINVSCYIVGDIDTVDPDGSLGGIDDIWDALRINIGEWPHIGNNNLEIAIDDDKHVFSRPIDVVYIPMSRMVWKSPV
jgi:TolB-like protein